MSKRTESLARTRTDLDNASERLAEAIRLVMDTRPGIPGAQSFDGPNITSGGDTSSPTERCALNPDRTRPQITQLDKVLRRLAADALWLLRFTEANSPHAPSQKDQAKVAAANTDNPDDWCTHHRTFGHMEPTHRTSTVGGNLTVPMPLCRWCYDHVRTEGRLPTADRMERLARGRSDRVRV